MKYLSLTLLLAISATAIAQKQIMYSVRTLGPVPVEQTVLVRDANGMELAQLVQPSTETTPPYIVEQEVELTLEEVDRILEADALAAMKVGTVIFTLDILYNYDHPHMLPESQAILQPVLDLMREYPSLVIEVGHHTDQRGSANYNYRLSEMRAESVVRYLQHQGIDVERLVANGYGETQPLVEQEEIMKLKSRKEVEEAYQRNRRTEFKLLAK